MGRLPLRSTRLGGSHDGGALGQIVLGRIEKQARPVEPPISWDEMVAQEAEARRDGTRTLAEDAPEQDPVGLALTGNRD